MALNFPNSPSNGDTATLGGGNVYLLLIKRYMANYGYSGGVPVSDTPPASPANGDTYYDSTELSLFTYYNDGSSAQWVQSIHQAHLALEQ